jgi:hypothetical protein
MMPLILLGALVLVVLGFLIAFEIIPLFPGEKRWVRPRPERKATPHD